MDGVLVREEHALPGAAEFLARLVDKKRPFLVLTNNSIFTPRDLSARLLRSGLTVPEASIWTSALATAAFLSDQLPDGSRDQRRAQLRSHSDDRLREAIHSFLMPQHELLPPSIVELPRTSCLYPQ